MKFGKSGENHIQKSYCDAGYCNHQNYPKRHIGCPRNGFEHAEFNKQETNREYSILLKCDACGEERLEYHADSILDTRGTIDPDSILHKQNVIGECEVCMNRTGTFVVYGDRTQIRRCNKCKRETFVIDPVASFYGAYGPLSGDEIEELNEEWARYTRGKRY